MLQFIKKVFNRRYIKFKFVGKYGLSIKSNLNDSDLQDFLFMIYNQTLINDIMNNIKVNNEDQHERVENNLLKMAEEIKTNLEQVEEYNNEEPIIGVLSENNSMGRS